MIQILLLILKIIGILILTVLGTVFFVLALVLFVPVFYQVRIIHNPQQTKVTAKISFLWPAIAAVVQYLKKISFKVKIFGIPILDSEKIKKEKPEKVKKPKKAKKLKKVKKQPSDAAETQKEENLDSLANETPEKDFSADTVLLEEKNEEQSKGKKQGIFAKIKAKIQNIKETISNLVSKIKKLLHQKDEVLRILGKPETKKAIGFAFGKLGRLLKHILPRKIKGYVVYGADNPATTGQVLGIVSVIYARTGQILEIRPNFMEKQLECDVLIKGRIQVFTLLLIAVKVILNKGVRQVLKEFKGIKDIE